MAGTPNKLIFANSEKARNAITVDQQKRIAKLYEDWSKDLGERAKYYANKTTVSSALSERQAKELKKALTEQSHQVSNEVYKGIKQSIYTVSDAVVKDNVGWLRDLGFSGSSLDVAFSSVPDNIVRMLVTGQIYEGGWNLSSRIWSSNEKTLSNCYEIVAKGMAENRPIYDIAKELEKYVSPQTAKSWNPMLRMKNTKTGEWEYKRIYRGKVDYNAQRLARTLVQHGYQQSFVAVTEKNPFVLKYQWSANGSRACPLCLDRDGQVYEKDNLPMDHPNGQCTMIPVIDDNLTNKLADWFNSPDGTYPDIDEFAKEFGHMPQDVNKISGSSYISSLFDSVTKQFVEKFGISPDVSSISTNADDFTDLMSGAYAYIEPSDGSLHVNPNVFTDEETFYNVVGGKIRAYHPNATPESILAHEYGHSVSLKVNEQKIIDDAVAQYVAKYPKSGMDAYLPDYQYAAESISHYAVTTEHELFAEAFGDVYANGDKAQELSKMIVEGVQKGMKQ